MRSSATDGLRDGVRHLREVLHRLEELRQVREEHGQRAGGHRAGEDQRRAAPQHEPGAQRDDDRHHRREQRLDLARLERRVDRRAARRRHARHLEVLPAERLRRRAPSPGPAARPRRSRSAACAPRASTSFTAFLKRKTNSSRNGVTATAISVKSQLSQNMSPSMPTMVIRSTRMPSVDDDAKSCTVETSLVIVDSSVPVCVRVVEARATAGAGARRCGRAGRCATHWPTLSV